MEKVIQREIMHRVRLTCVRTDKFKTGCFSVHFLAPIRKETAAKNALLPRVLRRGTATYPDMQKLAAALDELYGARIQPVVRKKGEVQCVGFYADFVDDFFLPKGSNVLEQVIALVGEMVLSPETRYGKLHDVYVDSEKEKLIAEIRAGINNKRQYSVKRVTELMCAGEAFGVSRFGTEAAVQKITAAALTKQYKELLASSPVEIFYCGNADVDTVERLVTESFADLPRRGVITETETEILLAPPKKNVVYHTEAMNVTQGKLAMGFRLGACMQNLNYPALLVFNAIYGGAVTSKLFMNVRERLSLCYFASSILEWHKGLMIVSSGIEFSKYQLAYDEILAQLEAVRTGDFTEEELESARKDVVTTLKTVGDSQTRLENYSLDDAITEIGLSPDDLAALAASVKREDVLKIAAGVRLDTVYFLTGENGDVKDEVL